MTGVICTSNPCTLRQSSLGPPEEILCSCTAPSIYGGSPLVVPATATHHSLRPGLRLSLPQMPIHPQCGPVCTNWEHDALRAVRHNGDTSPGWSQATYLIFPEIVNYNRPVSVGVFVEPCLLCPPQERKLVLAKRSRISVTLPSLHLRREGLSTCRSTLVVSVYFTPVCESHLFCHLLGMFTLFYRTTLPSYRIKTKAN